MSRDMPSQISTVSIPATVARRLRFQPGALAVIGQHSIRLELEQIIDVQILRMLQRPTGQPHCRQRQRTRDIWDCVLDLLRLAVDGYDKRDRGKIAQANYLSSR